MFQSARIKLTLWYLIVTSVIALSFSGIIYRVVTLELERGYRLAEYKMRGQPVPQHHVQLFLQEEFNESKRLVLIRLLLIDGMIISTVGAVGYFLAGKTLHPIEVMTEEQKRFIADASHELKTPITALQTSIEVALRDKKLNLKNLRNVLFDSLDDIESLKKLTNDLLSLARYQKDNNFRKEKVNMKEVVDSVSKKMLPLTKKKKINLILRSNKVQLTAHKDSMEKLVTILLDNAIKYTRTGGDVSLTLLKKKNKLLLIVKDTGIGISRKDRVHIFDRFYQADSSRTSQVGGFGLGLSIAIQIVKLHKGKVEVKSKKGMGSTFIVRLPLE